VVYLSHRLESNSQCNLFSSSCYFYRTQYNPYVAGNDKERDPASSISSSPYVTTSQTLVPSFGQQLTYVMFELAFSSCVCVIIMFWATIYSPCDASCFFWDFLEHGLVGIWIIIEFIFNRITFLVPHLVAISIYFSSYLILNCVYSLESAPVYDILTWKDP